MPAVAWTTKAGTHGPLKVTARAVLGSPVGTGVIIAADHDDGRKAVALEIDVADSEQLYEQLGVAIKARAARTALGAEGGGGMRRYLIDCPRCGTRYTVEDDETGEPPRIYTGGLLPVTRCVAALRQPGVERICNADLAGELAGQTAAEAGRRVA